MTFLMLTVKLFNEHPDVLQHYRDQFKFMLVDEFQDTNFVQMEIIRLIGGNRPNLCVVGDDDQSIYSWRGAEVQNILDFRNSFRVQRLSNLSRIIALQTTFLMQLIRSSRLMPLVTRRTFGRVVVMERR